MATTERMIETTEEMLKPFNNPVTAKFGLDRVPTEDALQVIEERSQGNTGSGI